MLVNLSIFSLLKKYLENFKISGDNLNSKLSLYFRLLSYLLFLDGSDKTSYDSTTFLNIISAFSLLFLSG